MHCNEIIGKFDLRQNYTGDSMKVDPVVFNMIRHIQSTVWSICYVNIQLAVEACVNISKHILNSINDSISSTLCHTESNNTKHFQKLLYLLVANMYD